MSDKIKCKPGGCLSLGCEGGRYCYNIDGTKREPDSSQAALELIKSLEATNLQATSIKNDWQDDLHKRQNARSVAEEAVRQAAEQFDRKVRRGRQFEFIMKAGLVLAVILILLSPFVFKYCLS